MSIFKDKTLLITGGTGSGGSSGTVSGPWISGGSGTGSSGSGSGASSGSNVPLPDAPNIQVLTPQQTVDTPDMPLAPTPSIPSLPSTTATTAMMGIEQENKPVK